jgi:chemotaxis protein histidine kinase CheA
VETIEGRAVLRVSAGVSKTEIESAYSNRISEVRKRFEDARDQKVRVSCRGEFISINEARRTLLWELEEEERHQREEKERLEAEQRQREKKERLEAEQRQNEEKERLEAEQRQREKKEQLEAERRQREKKERLEAEQRQHEEKERLEAEQRQREKKERLEAEQRQHEEKERLEAEQRQHEEKERLETEQRQHEEKERLETEQRQREKKERLEAEQRQREEKERLEAERRQREKKGRSETQQSRWRNPWLIGAGATILVVLLLATAFFLPHQPASGKLVVNTIPDQANVWLDGTTLGMTSQVFEGVSPGRHHLKIDKKGYRPVELDVSVIPGEQETLQPFSLEPVKTPDIGPPTTIKPISPETLFAQGEAFRKGDRVWPKNLRKAFDCYLDAAKQGLAAAQQRVGAAYSLGEGVEKSDSEAVLWFRKAAEQGFAEGEYELGVRYILGLGVENNVQAGLSWYRKAAAQGYQPAIDDLKKADAKTAEATNVANVRLKNLRNQVGFSLEQERKTFQIIRKYVDDRQAVNENVSLSYPAKVQKLQDLMDKYHEDIRTILTAEQQKLLPWTPEQ